MNYEKISAPFKEENSLIFIRIMVYQNQYVI